MEPEIKEFLKRVASSVFVGLLWMALNSTFGIMYDFAFIHDKLSLGNILYYIFFVASLTALIWYYIRQWKKPLQ
ncbi:MAG TPA: hypothetical protein PL045_12855 [Chitinophagaceae bacterium]|nr:hypothetical protein [Chitinophagaceae bacterium]